MTTRPFLLILGGIAAFTAFPVFATVDCPPIFGDHMVLQRDKPVPVWGQASPGETVSVMFGSASVSATASSDGTWSVDLPAMKADSDGQSLVVKGASNTLNFQDVLVGDVWLCSGQSNMEKPVGPRPKQKPTDNYEEAIKQADHPLIRFFVVPHYGKPDKKGVGLKWVPCSPESIVSTQFSAVAYYFGREIQARLHIPIGLIHSSFGGTPIDQWMPPSAFASEPRIASMAGPAAHNEMHEGFALSKLYQTMIQPLEPFRLKGILWYQGETNLMAAETDIYTDKMRAMVRSWREAFNDPDLPFYYVQIAPFEYSSLHGRAHQEGTEALPVFWEAQTAALSIPHTGMVVTTDIVRSVKDIHPTNKLAVGQRLAGLALEETYGQSVAEPHSAQFDHATFSASSVTVFFHGTGGTLGTRDGKAPDWFEVAGDDKVFEPAIAEIQTDHIVLHSDAVAHPVAVRFAWSETAQPNLEGATGLPVTPFRTDHWPVVVEVPKTPAPEEPATPAISAAAGPGKPAASLPRANP